MPTEVRQTFLGYSRNCPLSQGKKGPAVSLSIRFGVRFATKAMSSRRLTPRSRISYGALRLIPSERR
jgi:hypothetical protein